MNAQHTPGPWEVEDGYAIVSTEGEFIASCNESDDNCNADAALIAAAPDLLAALEIAEGRLMCIDAQKLDTVARNDDVIDRIRAAIAKAKGE